MPNGISLAGRERQTLSWAGSIHRLCFSNKIGILYFFVPIGIISGILSANPVVQFWTNFMAIIPLAAVISDSTEDLTEAVGDTLGGLLNATFGNVVELIVALFALYRNEIRIVQTSLLGSIISNLLLVLGASFLAGGYNRVQQSFNATAAQTMSSLMNVGVISLLIPAAFLNSVPKQADSVVTITRLSSVVLLIIYALCLYFQLFTHQSYFEGEREETSDEPIADRNKSLTVLVVATLLVAWCAEYLVGSIEGLFQQTGLSRSFIGFILLPIVGNAAEHVTAVMSAMHGRIGVTIGVAVGSSMQIALCQLPLLVIWGWIIGVPMSLSFHLFETSVMFVAVFVANSLIQDGESNWLEGVLLLGTYAVIAISFWFYPDDTRM